MSKLHQTWNPTISLRPKRKPVPKSPADLTEAERSSRAARLRPLPIKVPTTPAANERHVDPAPRPSEPAHEPEPDHLATAQQDQTFTFRAPTDLTPRLHALADRLNEHPARQAGLLRKAGISDVIRKTIEVGLQVTEHPPETPRGPAWEDDEAREAHLRMAEAANREAANRRERLLSIRDLVMDILAREDWLSYFDILSRVRKERGFESDLVSAALVQLAREKKIKRQHRETLAGFMLPPVESTVRERHPRLLAPHVSEFAVRLAEYARGRWQFSHQEVLIALNVRPSLVSDGLRLLQDEGSVVRVRCGVYRWVGEK